MATLFYNISLTTEDTKAFSNNDNVYGTILSSVLSITTKGSHCRRYPSNIMH